MKKQNKVVGLVLLDFKTYIKVTIIKTVILGGKTDTEIDGTASSAELDSYKQILSKSAKTG